MARTEISEYGEFGLIKHLTKDLKPVQPSTKKGVGDDCAVMDFGSKKVLMTTDMLLEGIHFNLEYVPLKHLGYKAAVVNFSDIYAMNGTPTQITVSLGISKRFSVEDIEELYSGIRLACERYGVDLVGGDTCASMTGLSISITCLGTAAAKDIVYRNGAKLNDLICVSGNLGTAYMGLQLLERERIALSNQNIPNNQSVPSAFEGREYLLERQLKPEARRDILEALKKAGVKPTAMMDISDGLSSELMHICTQSGVGCCIYEDKLPIDFQAASLAEEMNLNIVTCALNGGEDYELLFTCSLDDYEKLIPVEDLYIIGHITKQEYGCNLIGRNGEELALKARLECFPRSACVISARRVRLIYCHQPSPNDENRLRGNRVVPVVPCLSPACDSDSSHSPKRYIHRLCLCGRRFFRYRPTYADAHLLSRLRSSDLCLRPVGS